MYITPEWELCDIYHVISRLLSHDILDNFKNLFSSKMFEVFESQMNVEIILISLISTHCACTVLLTTIFAGHFVPEYKVHACSILCIYIIVLRICLAVLLGRWGFHVLGRQLDELLASLATSNSVHHDLLLCIYVSFIIMHLCWK